MGPTEGQPPVPAGVSIEFNKPRKFTSRHTQLRDSSFFIVTILSVLKMPYALSHIDQDSLIQPSAEFLDLIDEFVKLFLSLVCVVVLFDD